MFDVPPGKEQELRWTGNVPLDEKPWNVGLIVGPSGCGKSTVARTLFADAMVDQHDWRGASVLDDFPATLPIDQLSSICQAVGFNTIPAWLRPYHVLSNGERFRVDLARTLVERPEIAVVDEFTSVVDRQVAKIGSHAVQKHVRKAGSQFVAVSCHYDIIEWLQPDWILEPATMTFSWRSVQRRPTFDVEIQRVDRAAWKLFAPYHYMSAELHTAAQCFVLSVAGRPAVFGAMLYRPHPKATNIWGLSRLVTLPDFQGLGLAFVLTDALGGAFAACRQRMHTYPAHPALIRAFDRSKAWKLEKRPGIGSTNRTSSTLGAMGGRPNAVFSYGGTAWDSVAYARRFLSIRSLLSTT